MPGLGQLEASQSTAGRSGGSVSVDERIRDAEITLMKLVTSRTSRFALRSSASFSSLFCATQRSKWPRNSSSVPSTCSNGILAALSPK
jgi:hypothetical protein